MTLRLRDTDCTYFLCPDKRCRLFRKPGHVPCDRECPHQAKKAIVCFSCRKTITLPYDHFSWCRVDCTCGAQNFQRMSGRYRRHNLKP
jgi:hypothetical protein